MTMKNVTKTSGIAPYHRRANAAFRVLMDRIGNTERTSYAINLEHRF
jgi:hypothetical protein